MNSFELTTLAPEWIHFGSESPPNSPLRRLRFLLRFGRTTSGSQTAGTGGGSGSTIHKSPARYRNRLAVDLARKLIYEQRLSNKELAEKLHFCDDFHFSRRFLQATGQSPKAFRRSLPATG